MVPQQALLVLRMRLYVRHSNIKQSSLPSFAGNWARYDGAGERACGYAIRVMSTISYRLVAARFVNVRPTTCCCTMTCMFGARNCEQQMVLCQRGTRMCL